MASRAEQLRQDQATEQRRQDAVGYLIDNTAGGAAVNAQAAALAALSALIEAIEGERDDITELRRKGWQTRAREQDAAVTAIKEWRDRLASHTPPTAIEAPTPAEIIPRTADPAYDLEQRLVDSFGPELAPVRHIRTAINEVEYPDGIGMRTEIVYGPLCGAKTGSFTHPGGANCEECHAHYTEQNDGKPYDGPTAYGNPTGADVLAVERVNSLPDYGGQFNVTISTGVGDETYLIEGGTVRRDEPVTPTVARQIREEVEREGGGPLNVTILGAPAIVDPRMPDDTVAVVSPEDAVVFKVGDKVTVGAGGNAIPLPAMPTVIEPPTVRPSRERMTLAQVREHGLARARGREHRSVSQVQGYADCGTRYALSDLERPAWWNVGGKAFHACAEEINRAAVNGIMAGPEDPEILWLRHFDAQIAEQHAATPDHPMDTWRAANRSSEHYDWWRVEGPAMVSKYVVWLASMLREGWTIATAESWPHPEPVIEYEARLDVGIGVPSLSIIDLALVRPVSGTMLSETLIIDLKAGSSAPKDTFQLGVYGWAALAAGIAKGPMNVRGAYYRARKGELTAPMPVLDLHPWPDVVQRYRDQDTMERQGVYMPNVTTFCGGCGVRDLCPAQANVQPNG